MPRVWSLCIAHMAWTLIIIYIRHEHARMEIASTWSSFRPSSMPPDMPIKTVMTPCVDMLCEHLILVKQ